MVRALPVRWSASERAPAPASRRSSATLEPVMPPRPYILVVNGRKVRQPVFVIGAPHSGADLLARALKQASEFHLTIGQPAVLSVVYAFARSPSIQEGRGEAAATVLRDAFAQAWQGAPHACLACLAACRQAGRLAATGTCVDERSITRYGDASPELMYCAEALLDAFPDARLVQIIREAATSWRRCSLIRSRWPGSSAVSRTSTRSSPIRSSVSRPKLTWRRGRSYRRPANARCAGVARCTRWRGCAAASTPTS